MSADTVATITPRPEAEDCDGDGDDCDETSGLATVDPEDTSRDSRTLCGDCRLDYFEELRA